MTSESGKNRVLNDVADRDAASGLRGRRKSTSEKGSNSGVPTRIKPIAAAAEPVAPKRPGPARLWTPALTVKRRAKTKQNPTRLTRFFAASGLLERRI